MEHLSTSTDISNQIGALELSGQPESYADGALESAGRYLNPLPQPTQMHSCILTFVCRIDDGALEAAGANMEPLPQPTQFRTGCGGPTFVCRIDDGALEAAGANMALMCGPPVTQYPFCPRIGDDALEAAGANEAQPTGLICKTQPAMCGY
jgi:hypothetical protein